MDDLTFKENLAQLYTRRAIDRIQVLANPEPYLDRLAERCCQLQSILEEVDRALHPDTVFDYWLDHADHSAIPRPVDIQGEALIRCNRALRVLDKYRRMR